MKKKIIFSLVLVVLVGGFFLWQNQKPVVLTVDLPVAQNYQDFSTSTKEALRQAQGDEVEKTEEKVVEVVKDGQIETEVLKPEIKNINLNVPFTSQAPSGNWEQPYQDACEEASFLMLDYYYQNKKFSTAQDTEKLINTLVDWQITNWGVHANLPAQEFKKLVEKNSSYQVELVYDLSVAKIKNILQTGQPIIVPANGKLLANPNFKNGGPEYHMLVVKGYVDDKFITNDPGTRLGADFIYSSENLLYSIADWNTQDKKANGPKIGIVIKK